MRVRRWRETLLANTKKGGSARQLEHVAKLLDIEVETIVELGVYKGGNARNLRKRFPQAKIHLIDAWRHLWDSGPMMRQNPTDDHWERIYQDVLEEFKHDERMIVHRMMVEDGHTIFDNESLDAVFIDADHRYESVKRDILDWLPKVRPGKILAGHDYKPSGGGKGVVKAVNEIFGDQFVALDNRVWVHIKHGGKIKP